jgi:hypothetical protein
MHQVQELQTVAPCHETLLLFHSNQFIKTKAAGSSETSDVSECCVNIYIYIYTTKYAPLIVYLP